MKKVVLGLCVLCVGVLAWFMSQQLSEDVTKSDELASHQLSPPKNGGFSQDATDAINSNQPSDLLSIDGLPVELRSVAREALELEVKNGFGDVSDFQASEIVDIEKYIIGSNPRWVRIPFKPSALPGSIVDSYEYIGYTLPNYSIKKSVVIMKNGTLRRVFKHRDSGSILVIEESSDSVRPRATLLKEAVNISVADTPAIYGLKKSPNGKTYASLNWTTEVFAYVLYQFNDLYNARQTLVHLGGEITLNN